MKNSGNISRLIPVMLAFFTMGFVDLVGIATNYVKADFTLSDTMANILPSMVFLWFFVFGVPTGLLMNKIGRKKTVLLSFVMTIPSLVLPMIHYSFGTMLVSFILLGIGNTLLQVSLNPLLANIVSKDKISSTLTFGQFVKAIASFIAPVLAGWAASSYHDWRMIMFPGFTVITIAALAYMSLTKIEETGPVGKPASFRECFALLGDGYILLFFIGIMAHVGLDVGINTTAPRILMEHLGIDLSVAGYATSFYFIFRTAGCLMGSYFLGKFGDRKVFMVSITLITLGIIALFSSNRTLMYAGIAAFGLGNSNIFPIIFTQALIRKPMSQNEISGLMITGIVGGAIIPLLMGIATDMIGGQAGALIVLLVCVGFLIALVSPKVRVNKG
ncbi:MAG TPA: MFS transporter [Bacteroidales bacterium]|jgi:fucose permease|nr:MFS transporter [Bacteroidales bacterium]